MAADAFGKQRIQLDSKVGKSWKAAQTVALHATPSTREDRQDDLSAFDRTDVRHVLES